MIIRACHGPVVLDWSSTDWIVVAKYVMGAGAVHPWREASSPPAPSPLRSEGDETPPLAPPRSDREGNGNGNGRMPKAALAAYGWGGYFYLTP
jgi:hypothetical protein